MESLLESVSKNGLGMCWNEMSMRRSGPNRHDDAAPPLHYGVEESDRNGTHRGVRVDGTGHLFPVGHYHGGVDAHSLFHQHFAGGGGALPFRGDGPQSGRGGAGSHAGAASFDDFAADREHFERLGHLVHFRHGVCEQSGGCCVEAVACRWGIRGCCGRLRSVCFATSRSSSSVAFRSRPRCISSASSTFITTRLRVCR